MLATTNKPNPAAVATRSGPCLAQPPEFLSFTLSQEAHGIDIQKVQETRGYDTVARLANAPTRMSERAQRRVNAVKVFST